jgi:hypothetical protein
MTGLAPDQGTLLLKKQLAELQKNPVDGFSAGLVDDNDIYKWEVMIIGPPDTFLYPYIPRTMSPVDIPLCLCIVRTFLH